MLKFFVQIIAIFLLFCQTVSAQNAVSISPADDFENQLIIEFKDIDRHRDFMEILKSIDLPLTFIKKLSQNSPLYLIHCADGSKFETEELLWDHQSVVDILENKKLERRNKPNDPKLSAQWTLDKIGMDKAWDYTTGGETIDGDEIVVAVLDDGFDIEHEDLIDNYYNNPYDQVGDMNNDGCPGKCGVDDDGDGLIDEDFLGRQPGEPGYDNSYMLDDDENGYKDDVQGFNVKNGSGTHAFKTHGTSVAGIIGAKGNNDVGIAGINWNVKILPISEGLFVSNVIEAYNYLADMRRRYNASEGSQGAFIVACNFSAGISDAFPEDYRPWCDMYDIMGEQGILNVVAVPNISVNIDISGDIPSLCESPYLIAVTSTDQEDNIADKAGFGPINVDIAAPGEKAYTVSATKEEGYGVFEGTSASTPHVAGAIGLLYSIPCQNFLNFFKQNPSKVDSLANIIIESGDVLESMSSLTKSESRLNVYKVMAKLGLFCGGSEDEFTMTNLRPNPVQDQLIFDFIADPTEEIYVEIYNTLGQKMNSRRMIFPLYDEPQYTVNTGDLIAGFYYLSMIQGKKRIALKFIKE